MPTVNYNGQSAYTLRERVAAFFGKKDAPLPVGMNMFQNLPAAQWNSVNAVSYFNEGYRLNSAVFACTRTLAQGFSEPPLLCYSDETKKKALDKHPLRALIKRPNEWMGEDELWRYWVVYAISTGNAYGKIVPTNGGRPGELWPYSDLVMRPVAEGKKWIARYEYSVDNWLHKEDIDPREIVHYKYAPDPFTPMKGMGALRPIAREVDTDNELTRYLKSLLQNDAVPRGVLTVPDGVAITETQKVGAKLAFEKLFAGDNRGKVAIFDKGMDYKRIALDLGELAFDALRGVPEARIASAYGVPAIVAGLNIGLARSTYSNYEEARKAFTEQTLVPMWKSVASEIQQSLVPLYGNDCYVDFDLTQVRALAENTNLSAVWVVDGWDKGLLTRNQALAKLGEEAVTGPDGDAYKTPPPAPEPNPVGAVNSDTADAQPPKPAKASASPLESKSAELPKRAQGIEKQFTKDLEEELQRAYTEAASRLK